METESVPVEGIAFRPAKRRKFTRNRRLSVTADSDPQPTDTACSDNDIEAVDAPVSEMLRLRKKKLHRNGIEFSNTRTRSAEPPPPAPATVDINAERIKAISDRFVAHSGQVVDVDRHMFVFPHPQSTYHVYIGRD